MLGYIRTLDTLVHANIVCVLPCRLKEVAGARPHTQINAEKAAGMGAPDNGEKARPAGMEM